MHILKVKNGFILLIGFFLVMTACSDTTLDDETSENYVDSSSFLFEPEAEGNVDKMRCFELIFPVIIQFPDGSTFSIDDYDSLRTKLDAWAEANPDLFNVSDNGRNREEEMDMDIWQIFQGV